MIIDILVDCTWSEWTRGDCSKTCGEGARINTRVMFEEQFGGKGCVGKASVTEFCQLEKCTGNTFLFL